MPMLRLLALAACLIFILTLIVWAFSQFVQPILPPEISSTTIVFFLALVAVVGVLAGLNEILELLSKFQERINRHLLNQKFARGPFDKATIERATRYYIRPKCSNIDP